MKEQTTRAVNGQHEQNPVRADRRDNQEQMRQAEGGVMGRVGLFAKRHQGTIIIAASVLVFLAMLRFGHKNEGPSCREGGRCCG